MSIKTKPSYTADTQTEITQFVPDSEDGITAFAISEQTAWQLSKTSTATIGANALATKSGTGRWLKVALANSIPAFTDYFYGIGLDGSATIAVNTNLSQSMLYTDLTVNAGIVLSTVNHAVQCTGTLTLAAGGIIANDGADGSGVGTSGASGILAGDLMNAQGVGGGAGGTSGNNGIAPGASTRGIGGTGGAGGNSSPRTGGAGGTNGTFSNLGFFNVEALNWRNASGSPLSFPMGGAAGGGGAGGVGGTGATGSGGGAGGGLLLVRANAIVVSAGSLFRALGGHGGNCSSATGGGGGGGGGGFISVVCNSFTMPGGSTYASFFSVAGGAGGTSVGASAGSPGNTGKVRLFVGGQLVYSLN